MLCADPPFYIVLVIKISLLFIGGTGCILKLAKRRKNEGSFSWPYSSLGTTWRPACTTFPWKTNLVLLSISSENAWELKSALAKKIPLPPSSLEDTEHWHACGGGCRAMGVVRKTMRMMKVGRSAGVRWEIFSCVGSWGSLQTRVQARHCALRAASLHRGAAASARQQVSAWWSQICPTLRVTAATWLQTTVQVCTAKSGVFLFK